LQVRGDQSTLNFSKVPTTIIEVGNMRNAKDAARMSSATGQQQYAQWLAAGIEEFFAG
jgi:N-acetylmuramoyl-L-alanine amidase